MFKILAYIIVIIICLLIAPFMTIGVIFLNTDWGIIGKTLGFIFIFVGFIHCLFKIFK